MDRAKMGGSPKFSEYAKLRDSQGVFTFMVSCAMRYFCLFINIINYYKKREIGLSKNRRKT